MQEITDFVKEDTLSFLVRNAIMEDLGTGDVSTDALVPHDQRTKAQVVAKAEGVLAGINVLERVFFTLDPATTFPEKLADGAALAKGTVVCRMEGSTRALLIGERTALNFLAHLSGIATEANRLAQLVAGKHLKILDTRKTTPLYRGLGKYAVQVGGCSNHRFGLYDMVLIKENHIAAAGGIFAAVSLAKEAHPELQIEVETTNEAEVRDALDAGAHRIMLDNMNDAMIISMVKLVAGRAETEA